MKNVGNIISSCSLKLGLFRNISEESDSTDTLLGIINIRLGNKRNLDNVVGTFNGSFQLCILRDTLVYIIPYFIERNDVQS